MKKFLFLFLICSLTLNTALWAICPKTVEVSPPHVSASNPKICADNLGNIHCLWDQLEGDRKTLATAVKGASECFFSEAKTVVQDRLNSVDSQIVSGVFRDAIAVWQHFDGHHYVIQAAKKPFGMDWNDPIDLSPLGQDAFNLQTCAGGGGEIIAVWQLFDGTNFVIQSSKCFFDCGWEAPVCISPPKLNASLPRVAVNRTGGTMAIWQLGDQMGRSILQSSCLSHSAIWQPPVDLMQNPIVGTKIDQTQLAMPNSGGAIAVWVLEHQDGTRVIQTSTGLWNGSWSSPITLSNVTGKAYHPQIAVSPEGEAIVNWQFEMEGRRAFIQSRIKRGDGHWEETVDLSPSEGNAKDHQVAITSGGGVLAVWSYERDGSPPIIQYRSRHIGGKWTEPLSLSSPELKSSLPKIAIDPFNQVSVVWQSEEVGKKSSIQYTDQIFIPIPESPPPPPPIVKPLPPKEFKGKVIVNKTKHKYKRKKDYRHLLSWKPSPDPTVVEYKIYNNRKRIAKIPNRGRGPYRFTYKKVEKNKAMVYYLVAVNAQGVRSEALKVVVE